MTTRERIEADYIKEFKAKNAPAIEALRMLRAAIKQIEVDSRKTLEEADVVEIVGREIKKLKDALDQFTAGGRADLMDKTKAEMALFQAYLPAQLSDEELQTIVKQVVSAAGEVSQKDFGRIMKEVVAATKGQADGGKVSQMVKEILSTPQA